MNPSANLPDQTKPTVSPVFWNTKNVPAEYLIWEYSYTWDIEEWAVNDSPEIWAALWEHSGFWTPYDTQ